MSPVRDDGTVVRSQFVYSVRVLLPRVQRSSKRDRRPMLDGVGFSSPKNWKIIDFAISANSTDDARHASGNLEHQR